MPEPWGHRATTVDLRAAPRVEDQHFMEDHARTTSVAGRSFALRARSAPAVRAACDPAAADRAARLRVQPREGSPRVPLRPHRPTDRVPNAGPARGRRPRRIVVRSPDRRAGPAGVRRDAARRASAARVDERDQGGARLPRARPSPLPGHRHGRCRPGRGRRGVGGGARVRLVAGRDHRRPRRVGSAPVDADRRSPTPAPPTRGRRPTPDAADAATRAASASSPIVRSS